MRPLDLDGVGDGQLVGVALDGVRPRGFELAPPAEAACRAAAARRAQRLIEMPAASRSKVPAVTPCSRRGTFWISSVGVLGSRSTKRM